MRILVTGGAGYIGSAAVKALLDKGHEVIVVDDLSNGNKKYVDKRAQFYSVDVTQKGLEMVFKRHKIGSVMHFAAYKAVEESMEDAPKYAKNITGTINILNMMVKYHVPQVIYSSTAAVYGMPKKVPVSEDAPIAPMSFYGFTKAESERIIGWYSMIHGIRYCSLRYFNVAGDAGLGYIDPDAKNIFPIIMEVLVGKRKQLVIFGDDYPTRDGTCIRDYIDVNDLVDAHIKALKLKSNEIINLGTAKGYTVKEIIRAAERATGKKVPFKIGPRRKGDPAKVWASNEKAREVLGWKAKRNVSDMIRLMYKIYMG